ncbi:MAG: hypothetical protein AAF211_05595 [Myxococcota bacterium]
MGRRRSNGLATLGLGILLTLGMTEGWRWSRTDAGLEALDSVVTFVVEVADTLTLHAGVQAVWGADRLELSATLTTDDGVSDVSVTAEGTLPEGSLWDLPLPDELTTRVTLGQDTPRR